MRAVVIGPGRIGCGFAGQLLHSSGYQLTFVARNRSLADHLRRAGRYRVVLADAGRTEQIEVSGFDVLHVEDLDGIADAISRAELVATAVGPRNLASVTPLIAAGLARTSHGINVLAFENLADGGASLRSMVAEHLPAEFPLERCGFSGAVVSRMVAHRYGDPAGDEPLTFLGDPPEAFIVDRRALLAPVPRIRSMQAVDRYVPWVLRKLYTFSAGHATTAYLGSLKGYHYIHTAIFDPEIRHAVLAAMREGQRGLAAEFGAEIAGRDEDLQRIITRFENAALNDSIARVGRDPRRKLGCQDRLVGAARMAARAGFSPQNLGLATAAALCFSDPDEPREGSLPAQVNRSGLPSTLKHICGLDASRGVGRVVADSWNQLAPGWRQGNLLLSLADRMWAWS